MTPMRDGAEPQERADHQQHPDHGTRACHRESRHGEDAEQRPEQICRIGRQRRQSPEEPAQRAGCEQENQGDEREEPGDLDNSPHEGPEGNGRFSPPENDRRIREAHVEQPELR